MALAGLIPGLRCLAQSNSPVNTFPASYATNYPEDFILRPDGKSIWNTNTDRFWRHLVWKEMTNGWRVALGVSTNASDRWAVALGSLITNSGGGYLKPPYGKFAKFELLNSDGNIMQPKPNAGTNLLKWYNHDLAHQTNQPAWASPTNGSLEVDFPATASAEEYPHFRSGSIVGDFDFFGGYPMPISLFTLGDLYSITNEDDYTLTVQPVLYKQFNHTNSDILDRVDLPSVTTKIHLVPNEKLNSTRKP